MKKFFALTLVLCLLLTVACGKDKGAEPKSDATPPAGQQQNQQAGEAGQQAQQTAEGQPAAQDGEKIAGVVLVKNQPQPKLRDDLPDAAKKYEGPTELSMDYTQPEFQLDGYVYRLPAPVEVFLMNGWKTDTNLLVSKGFFEWANFEKNGFEMDILVVNPNDNEDLPVKNCIVSAVRISSFTGVNGEENVCHFLYAGGIAPGMTAEQILAIAKEAKLSADGEVEYIPSAVRSNELRFTFNENQKADGFYLEWDPRAPEKE